GALSPAQSERGVRSAERIQIRVRATARIKNQSPPVARKDSGTNHAQTAIFATHPEIRVGTDSSTNLNTSR
ncbi:MAG: hypothetical protein KDJ39_11005, partial [Gammaproteobacteria bacterium]|nr:hypothetical protein [Gammaproteobacteria bacterium]